MKQSTEYKDLSKGLLSWHRVIVAFCLDSFRSKNFDDQMLCLDALLSLSKEDKEIIKRYCNNLADYLGCEPNKTFHQKICFLGDRKDLDKDMIP